MGADVNARDTFRSQTALMWAAARGNVDVVKPLLEAGADVNAKTPVVKRMHTNDRAAIHGGARRRRTNRGTVWLRQGSVGVQRADYAVRAGHIETVKVLLDGGANVNDTLSNGMAPLLLAVENLHYELAAYLLDRGRGPERERGGVDGAASGNPRAPGCDAVRHSDGARTGRDEQSGLHQEAPRGRRSPNVRMWNDGMNAGERTDSTAMGATPFFVAAKIGDLEVMKLLVAHGANPLTPTVDNITPLMAVRGSGALQSRRRRRLEYARPHGRAIRGGEMARVVARCRRQQPITRTRRRCTGPSTSVAGNGAVSRRERREARREERPRMDAAGGQRRRLCGLLQGVSGPRPGPGVQAMTERGLSTEGQEYERVSDPGGCKHCSSYAATKRRTLLSSSSNTKAIRRSPSR